MEERDREIEYYRATVTYQLAGWQETHRSVIDFAITAVKAALFINGGAAIALLAFLGHFRPAQFAGRRTNAIRFRDLCFHFRRVHCGGWCGFRLLHATPILETDWSSGPIRSV